MFLKIWILLAVLVAVAYAATEPLDLTALEESQDVSQPQQHIREKRFLLAKKAFLVGGALGFGVGLIKGNLLAGALQPRHYYPVHHAPVYAPVYAPHYGHGHGHGHGFGGGWSGGYHGYSSW